MTLLDELKTLDDNIKKNQGQYDRDREAAKTFALSSKEWDKYDYLTGGDLRYKPGVVVKSEVIFEYSPLGETLEKDQKRS